MIVVCANCGAKNRVDERAAMRAQPVCGRCGAKLNAGGGNEREPRASSLSASSPITVSDATFQSEISGAGERPVLLDCWAEWCAPCRAIAPVLEQLAAESNGRYVVAKLNVDDNPRTAAQFGIQSIPTLLIFKRGKLVDRLVGLQPKATIAARLASHV